MEEKIKELAQNEEFCEKLAATESAEEAVKLFAEEGVEVTAEELTAAFAEIPAGELDESTLENVAGGVILSALAYRIGRKLGGKATKMKWAKYLLI